jgi:hypothetical protein
MAGFNNETMYANNVDFTGSTSPTPQVTADGQLLIGSATSPRIRVGTLSGSNGITVTNGSGTIALSNVNIPNSALQNSSVTLSNGNNITITGSPLSLGGSATIAVSGTTNHAIQLGNASGSLTSASVLTNGQLLIGSTGVDPVAANITSSGGTITVTNGAGTINLEAISAGTTATVQTTDDTQTTLATISVSASSCVTVKGSLSAAQSDFSNGVGGDYIITARRTGAGSATIVGVATNNVQSSSAATFTCDVDAGTNSIRVRVTGVAATTYNWKTTYQTVVQS